MIVTFAKPIRANITILNSSFSVIGNHNATLLTIMNGAEVKIWGTFCSYSHIIRSIGVDSTILIRTLPILVNLYTILLIMMKLTTEKKGIALDVIAAPERPFLYNSQSSNVPWPLSEMKRA